MSSSKEMPLPPMTEAIINFTNALYDKTCFDLLKKEEIRDILSDGQLKSKQWLLEEFAVIFKKNPNIKNLKTMVVGGWVGLLARALNHLDSRITADTSDINPDATTIATLTLDLIRGKAYTADMHTLDYSSYGCVINTSAEHIADLSNWSDKLVKGTFVIVQSNNGRNIEGHISCVDSTSELQDLLRLSEIYYAGELVFPNYTRFMIIGKK